MTDPFEIRRQVLPVGDDPLRPERPRRQRGAAWLREVMAITSPLVQAPDPGGTPPKVGPGPRARILVVEDHEDSREMLRQFLQFEGYDVEVAADGRARCRRRARTSPGRRADRPGPPAARRIPGRAGHPRTIGSQYLARRADEPDDSRRSAPERGSGLRPARGKASGDRSAQGHPSRHRVTGELTGAEERDVSRQRWSHRTGGQCYE